jgi:hypothetical protein
MNRNLLVQGSGGCKSNFEGLASGESILDVSSYCNGAKRDWLREKGAQIYFFFLWGPHSKDFGPIIFDGSTLLTMSMWD